MAKEKLELEELRKKGLNHLAELLEAKVEDEEDEPEFDDEGEEKSKLEKSDKEEVKESAFDKAVENIYRDWETDRKSTRLNSSHSRASRMPSSA